MIVKPSSPYVVFGVLFSVLAFADAEHFGAAGRTDTLGRRFAVFHRDRFGTLHFLLGPTLHAICFHRIPPLLLARINYFISNVNSFSYVFKDFFTFGQTYYLQN